MELRLTDVAIAAATGHQTRLMRPPYSSEPNDVRTDTLNAWKNAVDGRHLVVLSTLDTYDWQKERTVDEMLASAMPRGHQGGIVLMHDGGGDRSRTLAALDRMLGELETRDYTIATIGEIAQLPRSELMPQVTATERLRDRALPVALRGSGWVADAFTVFAFAAALLALLRALILMLFARRHAQAAVPNDPSFTPAVTIVVPAYNEEKGIEAVVRSLAASRYPDFEVIVVDDGSSDNTSDVVRALVEREHLHNVELIRQPNGGKAHALNTGISHARGEIVVTVDGDTVFAPESLAAVVHPFRDAQVGAVSGNTKVANRRRVLGRWQHIEYVMGFNLDRRMYDRLGCMPTVPGAIGAFRACALAEVGGFGEDTLAEDTDITMALHRGGWNVAYAPGAVAFTEAPLNLRDLWRQRYRWSYGTMQSVWKHRHAAVERGPGGRLGRRGLPYLLLFQVLLPLFGPAVDVFTLYGLVFLDRQIFLAYWLGFTGLQMGVAAYALRLDRESLRPIWAVPLQQFVYRQMMYLVVVQSVATACSGARMGWHKVKRHGNLDDVPAYAASR
jgi:cellulose synthase/poly-beta-1,6-N-acetylglucosamine synthase-like glycosyltransferase